MRLFAPLHSLPASGRRLALLAALLLAVYLGAWPLVWHLVVAPNASASLRGLRAEERALPSQGGRPLRNLLAGPQDLRLEEPGVTAQALAVWQVPETGLYGLRVEADDFARLYLDRRLLIDQPERETSLNQGQAEVFLKAGPHFLRIDLTNLTGQGWLRLLSRPPQTKAWQDLPREQLRPVELGNLGFWLGLVDWLEGLCLWGILGTLLAWPMLGLAGSWLRGTAMIFLALPMVLAVARGWPPALSLPYLNTYSPDLRFQVLGLLTYALFIGVAVCLSVDTWRRRLCWGALLVGLGATRVYAWPYSIYCGLHPDWTSFAGFHDKFQDLFLRHHLNHQAGLGDIVAYLHDVAANLYVGYPSGCFSFPALLMGAGAMAAQAALTSTGAPEGFAVQGHLLGPAFNLAYALLLARLGRRYLWPAGSQAWSWGLVLLLALLPTHIYLGANITYNLLADALHLALLLTGLWLMEGWQGLLATGTGVEKPDGWRSLRPQVHRGLILSLLLGLCLATKIVFLPALLMLLAYAGLLLWRHRQARHSLIWKAMPLLLLAALTGGGLVYGLIILRNVLNVPGFWRQLMSMTGDNTHLSLTRAGLGECLRIFFQDLLLPNLGHAGTLAGGLGLALLGWRALRGRDLPLAMVFLWALLTVGMNLLSWSMLLMFNAMPRSSMLMGLWLALGLYFVKSLGDSIAARWGTRGQNLLRAGLVVALGLELTLAGLSLLVMYGAGSPRWRTEQFLRTLASGDKSVAAVMYLTHGDDPNTALGRLVPFHDLRSHLHGLSDPARRQRLVAQAGADYWLLTSYEAYFLRNHEADAQALGQELAQAGYVLQRRLDSRPFPGYPRLQGVYRHFLEPLLAGPRQGGLQEPLYVEVYARQPGQGAFAEAR